MQMRRLQGTQAQERDHGGPNKGSGMGIERRDLVRVISGVETWDWVMDSVGGERQGGVESTSDVSGLGNCMGNDTIN